MLLKAWKIPFRLLPTVWRCADGFIQCLVFRDASSVWMLNRMKNPVGTVDISWSAISAFWGCARSLDKIVRWFDDSNLVTVWHELAISTVLTNHRTILSSDLAQSQNADIADGKFTSHGHQIIVFRHWDRRLVEVVRKTVRTVGDWQVWIYQSCHGHAASHDFEGLKASIWVKCWLFTILRIEKSGDWLLIRHCSCDQENFWLTAVTCSESSKE